MCLRAIHGGRFLKRQVVGRELPDEAGIRLDVLRKRATVCVVACDESVNFNRVIGLGVTGRRMRTSMNERRNNVADFHSSDRVGAQFHNDAREVAAKNVPGGYIIFSKPINAP